ncbi:MAG: MFS transporter [Candidatus Bathyarchaeota archaeon]
MKLSGTFGKIRNFFERQTRNFRVLLATSVINNSIRTLTTGQAGSMGGGGASGASYIQLYLQALGADSQQIGLLNSLGKLANALVGLPLGWVSDRFSLKKVVIFGLILSVISSTAFAFSTGWSQAMPAMMLDAVATTLVTMFVALFFITSIKQASDRATAMSMRSTLTSIVGLIMPIISAIVVLNFGGITAEGIRPLFIITIVGTVVVVVYAFLKLEEVSFLQKKDSQKKSMWQDYSL